MTGQYSKWSRGSHEPRPPSHTSWLEHGLRPGDFLPGGPGNVWTTSKCKTTVFHPTMHRTFENAHEQHGFRARRLNVGVLMETWVRIGAQVASANQTWQWESPEVYRWISWNSKLDFPGSHGFGPAGSKLSNSDWSLGAANEMTLPEWSRLDDTLVVCMASKLLWLTVFPRCRKCYCYGCLDGFQNWSTPEMPESYTILHLRCFVVVPPANVEFASQQVFTWSSKEKAGICTRSG